LFGCCLLLNCESALYSVQADHRFGTGSFARLQKLSLQRLRAGHPGKKPIISYSLAKQCMIQTRQNRTPKENTKYAKGNR
jgi:hypothetical protein